MLLKKLRGHLDARQQRLLAGVAVLEKTRIGKQPRETVDALLCEATALQAASLPALLDLVERWIRQHRVPGTTPVRELKS